MISVIVPVYKTEETLEKCISSILKQTFRDFELILVDDGSPDSCGVLCDSFARADDRIRVIHKANGGLSDARNHGLEIAQGEYITFVDSDDYVAPELLEVLMRGIEMGAQVSACSFFTVREGMAKPWRKPAEGFTVYSSLDAVNDMLYTHSIDTSVWGKLFHRSCFSTIRFPVGHIYEEIAVTYRLMLTQKNVAITLQPLYYYVKRPNSIVSSGFSARQMDMMRYSEQILQYAWVYRRELVPAAQRRVVYACFFLLKTMGMRYRRFPNEVSELEKVFSQYRRQVLRDGRVLRRDKVAIALLSLGVLPFELTWWLYSLLTHRHGNS